MQEHAMAGREPGQVDHFATTMPAVPRSLKIEFTGSGSEYFRIWIVNLLLIIVTLGLYLPFAKARRISYFYANTHVDGQALAFHGDPWKMFRGFVLLAVLMGVYALAGQLSPTAGLVAFFVLCAVWPALWRASLQFRLANTSWRGLRFGFRGTLGGVYRAVLPVYLPSIILVLAAYWLDPQHEKQNMNTYAAIMGGVMLLMLIVLPWGLALIKRYQHGGYVYASQRSRLDVSVFRFFGLAFKTIGLALLVIIVACVLFAFVGFIAAIVGFAMPGDRSPALLSAFVFVGVGLIYLLFFVSFQPYFTARLQDLVWNGTRSDSIRFRSSLRFLALAWLTAKNLVLTVLTLGLYRPFAAVNMARLRLQAVSLSCEDNIDAWVAERSADQQDASGEAAGDFFGIDMGL